jgi:hypothetical protein
MDLVWCWDGYHLPNPVGPERIGMQEPLQTAGFVFFFLIAWLWALADPAFGI